ncbi:MAG: hypothetical protein K2P64_00565, partial [Lachnospiraceae bacterium]|nr:hypothetical protein [Lachnospiraceae bacterium]
MGQIKADMYGFADWRKEEFLKNLMTSVLLQKDQVQDQRIDRLDSQIDDLNRKLDVIFPDWNISGYSYNDVTSNKDIMDYETLRKDIVNSGQDRLFNNITAEVCKLEGLDDIRDQIAYCASVCNNTLNLLKKYNDVNDDNYSKRLLHLFYQIIKRNYSKSLFTQEQVAIMLAMIEA